MFKTILLICALLITNVAPAEALPVDKTGNPVVRDATGISAGAMVSRYEQEGAAMRQSAFCRKRMPSGHWKRAMKKGNRFTINMWFKQAKNGGVDARNNDLRIKGSNTMKLWLDAIPEFTKIAICKKYM